MVYDPNKKDPTLGRVGQAIADFLQSTGHALGQKLYEMDQNKPNPSKGFIKGIQKRRESANKFYNSINNFFNSSGDSIQRSQGDQGSQGAVTGDNSGTGVVSRQKKGLYTDIPHKPNSLALAARANRAAVAKYPPYVPTDQTSATFTPKQLDFINKEGPATPKLGAFDANGNPLKVRSFGGNQKQPTDIRQQFISSLFNAYQKNKLTADGARVLAGLLNTNLNADVDRERITTLGEQAQADSAFKALQEQNKNRLESAKLAELMKYHEATVNTNRTKNKINQLTNAIKVIPDLGNVTNTAPPEMTQQGLTILKSLIQSLADNQNNQF